VQPRSSRCSGSLENRFQSTQRAQPGQHCRVVRLHNAVTQAQVRQLLQRLQGRQGHHTKGVAPERAHPDLQRGQARELAQRLHQLLQLR
jgi:hypothetical protein